MDLTLLAPDLQEQLLEVESLDGVEPLHERTVRSLLRSPTWGEQRVVWREVGSSTGRHRRREQRESAGVQYEASLSTPKPPLS
jgi:hypothetical protein